MVLLWASPPTSVALPLPPSLPPVTVHSPERLISTWLPVPLSLQIERQLFEETVKTLNGFYAEAEKIGGSSYLEGCLACATAYFIFLCMETHYEKVAPFLTALCALPQSPPAAPSSSTGPSPCRFSRRSPATSRSRMRRSLPLEASCSRTRWSAG